MLNFNRQLLFVCLFTLNVKVNVHTINTSCSKHLAQTYPLIQKQKRDSFRCETLNRGSDNCFIDIAEFPDKMVAGVTRSAPSVTVSAGARASACVSQGSQVLSRGFSFQRLVFISLAICMINIYPKYLLPLKS